MGVSTHTVVEAHTHTFDIYESELEEMAASGSKKEMDTSEDNGHSHV